MSVLFRKYLSVKPRLLPHGRVANPRDTFGYRSGCRLALRQNPSVSLWQAICGTAH